MTLRVVLCVLVVHSVCLTAQAACPFAKEQNVLSRQTNRIAEHQQVRDGADPETTTPHNCKCTTHCSCGPTCDIGLIGGEVKDWCNTADNCGEYSLTFGYWDYCLYLDSSKPDYVAKNWEEKTNELIEQAMAEPSNCIQPNAAYIFTESVITPFDDEWDTMPLQREKYIHGIGAVCKFTLDITGSPYTGMFKDGKQTGIIRLGPAKDISNGAGVAPGAGIKFLRTGRTSGNFVALNSLTGSSGYNFFALTLWNHIGGPSGPDEVLLVNKFQQASSCPTKVALSDVARYDQDGNETEEPIFPFKVALVPTGGVSFKEEETPITDFMQQFIDNIPAGTELYSFVAHANPEDTEGTELAKLVITDGCYPSKFGDERLYFQHQRIEEDIELRPQWEGAYLTECK